MSTGKIQKQYSNKVAQFLYNNRFSVISALSAAAITLLIAFCYDMIPFGDMTILRMDMYHQYCPLFAELYDRVTSLGNMLYSWETGMGSSFTGNFFNYLCSPSAIFVLLFGHQNVPEAIAAMIFSKAAFAAGAFTYYLRKSFGKSNLVISAFGVLYSMCGWFIAYYWDVMWVDAMVFFPFVILGIERVINERKPIMLISALFLTFFTNYYMAYMVCIFSVLYFLAYYFGNYEVFAVDRKTKRSTVNGEKISFAEKLKHSVFLRGGVTFAFSGIAAAALAAFALVPVYFILKNCYATSDAFPEEWNSYFSVFDFLANHLSSLEPTIRSSGEDVLPNVYCGVITVILVPLYLFAKKIPTREKVANIILLGILYSSFNYNVISFVWHGFHYPSDLPYRFSFMYSFILLRMAFKAILNIKEYTGRQILGAGVCVTFFMILVQEITSKNVDDFTLIISLIFVIIYTAVLYCAGCPKYRGQQSAISMLLLCCVIGEIVCGNTNHYDIDQPKENYAGDYKSFVKLQDETEQNDEEFCRSELTYNRARMAPAWYGYNGISTFTSMAYESLSKLEKSLGLEGNNVDSYTYHLQTPVYNAMHALGYVYDNDDNVTVTDDYFTELGNEGDFTAYKNKYSTPLVYAVNKDVADWYTESGNPFSTQGQWFELATGIPDVFQRVEISPEDVITTNIKDVSEDFSDGYVFFEKSSYGSEGDISVHIKSEEKKHCYLYVSTSAFDDISINTDYDGTEGNFVTQYVDDPYIYDLGIIGKDDNVCVSMVIDESHDSGSISFHCYSVDDVAFEKGYAVLTKNRMSTDYFADTKIKGTINVDEGQLIYTSIPYDESWKVTIDGKKVDKDDIIALGDGLLCVNTEPGEHKVEFRFVQKGLLIGVAISASTAALLAIIAFVIKLYRKKHPDDETPVDDNDSHIFDKAFVLPAVNSPVAFAPEKGDKKPKYDATQKREPSGALKKVLSAAGVVAAVALPSAYITGIIRKNK